MVLRTTQQGKECGMSRVITKLTGTRPLLLHNVQLADPDNRWARQIAQITKKRKKTEEDRKLISDLEWEGGLYIHNGVISMPTANVLRAFVETAKIGKQGKTITRALTPTELSVPLIYSGPQDLEELKSKLEFRDQAMVRVGTQRVLRTRPIFRSWGVFLEWELLTEVLDLSDFERIVIQAGRVEGLGDNRTNGYGRFAAEVGEAAGLRRAA
jgi:hypothetical protein